MDLSTLNWLLHFWCGHVVIHKRIKNGLSVRQHTGHLFNILHFQEFT